MSASSRRWAQVAAVWIAAMLNPWLLNDMRAGFVWRQSTRITDIS